MNCRDLSLGTLVLLLSLSGCARFQVQAAHPRPISGKLKGIVVRTLVVDETDHFVTMGSSTKFAGGIKAVKAVKDSRPIPDLNGKVEIAKGSLIACITVKGLSPNPNPKLEFDKKKGRLTVWPYASAEYEVALYTAAGKYIWKHAGVVVAEGVKTMPTETYRGISGQRSGDYFHSTSSIVHREKMPSFPDVYAYLSAQLPALAARNMLEELSSTEKLVSKAVSASKGLTNTAAVEVLLAKLKSDARLVVLEKRDAIAAKEKSRQDAVREGKREADARKRAEEERLAEIEAREEAARPKTDWGAAAGMFLAIANGAAQGGAAMQKNDFAGYMANTIQTNAKLERISKGQEKVDLGAELGAASKNIAEFNQAAKSGVQKRSGAPAAPSGSGGDCGQCQRDGSYTRWKSSAEAGNQAAAHCAAAAMQYCAAGLYRDSSMRSCFQGDPEQKARDSEARADREVAEARNFNCDCGLSRR